MSLIIKMDAIKTEEHLRKSIPYIMNEKKTGGLCFSNSGITSEQILDTFFFDKTNTSNTWNETRVSFQVFIFQR